MKPPKDPNSHVQEYLKHYLDELSAPKFAVMLTGPWGVGKTYQIDRAISAASARKSIYSSNGGVFRAAKVSLYGVASKADFDDALIAAIYPWSQKKAVKITAAVGQALLKNAKLDLPKFEKSLIANKNSVDLFVFDDLERSSLPASEALGHINQLVEHDGHKAVLICNEQEVIDSDYKRIKEKLVGRSLEVLADLNAALPHFLSKHGTGKSGFSVFDRHAQIVRDAFNQSGYQNLRSLERSIWDIQRLMGALPREMLNSEGLCEAIVSLVLPLSIEARAGAIDSSDLISRSSQRWDGFFDKDKVGPSRGIPMLRKKYASIDLFSPVLSDEILNDLIFRGSVNDINVVSAVSKSTFFATPETEPEWRTVWYAFERDTERVKAAIDEMVTKFEQRAYDDPGIILHVFGQYIWLSEIGYFPFGFDDVFELFQKYVIDLRTENRLVPRLPDYMDDTRTGSAFGLGFYSKDKEQFGEFYSFLQDQREEALSDLLPAIGEELLTALAQGSKVFLATLSSGSDENPRRPSLHNRPVLATIDPRDFAEALTELSAIEYSEVLREIRARYSSGQIYTSLNEERSWLQRVKKELEGLISKDDVIEYERVVEFFQNALVVPYMDDHS